MRLLNCDRERSAQKDLYKLILFTLHLCVYKNECNSLHFVSLQVRTAQHGARTAANEIMQTTSTIISCKTYHHAYDTRHFTSFVVSKKRSFVPLLHAQRGLIAR